MLHAAVSARAVRFDERAAELRGLREQVCALHTNESRLKLALAAAQRESDHWRKKWLSEAAGNVKYASLDEVVRVVCAHYCVDRLSVLSERRSRGIVLPRHVAMYISRTSTLKSITTIGRYFRRDHVTVIRALEKMERLLSRDAALAGTVRRLSEMAISGEAA